MNRIIKIGMDVHSKNYTLHDKRMNVFPNQAY